MKKAVTLIEFIVAIGIFSIVIVIIMSSFSMAIKAQKRVISIQNIQDNAKFILDFMTKETRMSIIDNVTDGISNSLRMTRSSDKTSVVYTFDKGGLTRNNVIMNSSDISVTGSFYISGVVDNDNAQPRVTITMKLKGLGGQTEEEIEINTQATLCQRFLDF
ncbi:MAG: prepilin-type N-terminal cleavage/methylation domain-containing protein [Candidatus Portnoybacteria bacterium]|nr:prepilin-type N-terminal cleavage/methylation domain-containing protein [Candidatus Portnoybacteria bacterium]MDD5752384.1 prepilin-type N-terminal cleavage/methylation domain-containing protein [Candidatus Portnoybacteria bacterium]HPH52350.1 prepilin-type N-terminal cleavage/methylation domain-containing protein [Candidatus Portnoybacteria bacterium]